jgi:hypothetical protein
VQGEGGKEGSVRLEMMIADVLHFCVPLNNHNKNSNNNKNEF